MKKLPTVNIKGAQYTLVKDRVLAFNEMYPNGCIQTELMSEVGSDRVVMKAIVTPDCTNPERRFIDYAQETIGDGYINKTSALENCSTSACGRALAYMGIGVVDSIASVDEIVKATNQKPQNKVNLSEAVFVKLKYLDDKGKWGKCVKHLEGLGAEEIKKGKATYYAVPKDKQDWGEITQYIDTLTDADGNVMPFYTAGEAGTDSMPF